MQKHRSRRSKKVLAIAVYIPIALFGLLGHRELSIGSSTAFAQEAQNPEELARAHFSLGRKYYSKGRFEEAVREFEKAYEISQRSRLLFNIYLAYRDLNRLKPASDALRRYLASDANDPRREQLEARLHAMEESIRKREEEKQASDAPVEPSEPPEKEVEDEAETKQAQPTAVTPEEAVEPEVSGGRRLTLPSIVSFSVAGAGAITAIVFGSLALSKKGSLEDECAPECTEDEVDPVVTFRTLSDIGLGVAIAGAVVGGLLFYFSGPSEERAVAEASSIPQSSVKTGRFDLSWRF